MSEEDSSIPQMEPAVAVAGETVQERPSWLPEDWKFKSVVRMGGATAGLTDHYYYEPLSGKRFRSKIAVLDFLKTGTKRKKGDSETPKAKNKEEDGTSFFFDSANPPESVCWTLTDSNEDTWKPSIDGDMISEMEKQQWDVVFSSVSKLEISNTKNEK
ncbi:methyl-CpG-binding domain-containing protein 5-like [Solanum tuberosum]|nr:PREDICTED: methyl-CpG-binding domain-containing protein 5-like [Solanum tuberosum]KAH0728443.1 hypothetical protein KY284_004308 [Solanum tuberosum]